MGEYSLLIVIHVAAAVAALILGGVTFALPKGGKRHRDWARSYVVALLITTGVVIFVPATVLRFGDSGFGFFHLFIVVGGVSGLVGSYALYRWHKTKDPRWLRNHQVRFTFSYAGLWMAGVAQMVTNPRFGIVSAMTPSTFWLVFAAANLTIFLIAYFFVWRYIMRGDPRRRYALRP